MTGVVIAVLETRTLGSGSVGGPQVTHADKRESGPGPQANGTDEAAEVPRKPEGRPAVPHTDRRAGALGSGPEAAWNPNAGNGSWKTEECSLMGTGGLVEQNRHVLVERVTSEKKGGATLVGADSRCGDRRRGLLSPEGAPQPPGPWFCSVIYR